MNRRPRTRRRTRYGVLTVAAIAVLAAAGAISAGALGSTGSAAPTSIQSTSDLAARKAAADQAEASRVAALPRLVKPDASQALSSVMAAASREPDPPVPTEVLDTRQGPFAASSFDVQNRDQGPVNHAFFIVFAGATRNQDSTIGQAAVRVLKSANSSDPLKTDLVMVGDFIAPVSAQPLRATGIQGSVISLVSNDGTGLTFDLTTLSFD
jgi:hypothetical protein